MQIIEFLLENKANPYIKSLIAPKEEETILETACRWNYPAIVNLLLQKVKWPLDVLENASKISKGRIYDEVKLKIKEESGGGCKFCYKADHKDIKRIEPS